MKNKLATQAKIGRLGLAAGVIAAALGGCQSAPPAAGTRVCKGAQAISGTDLRGGSLPMKTLSLTFDDGPGPRTGELSTYLKGRGIRAAFFVNGKMVNPSNAALLTQMVADGHVLANHTQTHASLTGRSTGTPALSPAAIVSELEQTDAIIAPLVPANRFLFRAPYGDFDTAAADAIEASPMSKYVGTVAWDIGDHMGEAQAADWDCWRAGADGRVLSPQACGDLYVSEIESVGRGIVLMHEPYFIDDDPAKGGTVDMVEYIVPILVSKGYTFARVDEVGDIAELLGGPPPRVRDTDEGRDAGRTNDRSFGVSASTTGAALKPAAASTSASPMPGDRRPPVGGVPDPCVP